MRSNRIERVIYAWNYLSWGGAQIYFLGLLKEANKHFEISVLLPNGSDEQLIGFFRDQGVDCEFFGPPFERPFGNALTSRIRLHARKIASERAMLTALEENYDLDRAIVHIELSPWQSLFSLIWLALRTRVFITMHNSLPPVNPFRRALWKLKLRIISRFRNFRAFASNKDARSYFEGLYSDEFYKRLPVTYTNVDPDEIETAYSIESNPDEIRQKHGIPIDAFVVICVGQFIDRKGRWTFLEAAKKISGQRNGVHFVWVSNSKLGPGDQERVDSYGLQEAFSLCKSEDVAPDHIDLFRFMRSADIFVLPSFQEGLPISLLEAMALEVPCISTRVNAIPEAIEQYETGLLIESGDADGLASAILELKNDAVLRQRLASAGRKKVLDGFNEKEVSKIAVNAYFEAADMNR